MIFTPGTLVARIAIMLSIVLALVGFGAGTVWYLLSDKLAQAKAEQGHLQAGLRALAEQRVKDQATLARRAAANAAAARREAAARERLRAAVTVNRAWADEPLPKEIQDALASPAEPEVPAVPGSP